MSTRIAIRWNGVCCLSPKTRVKTLPLLNIKRFLSTPKAEVRGRPFSELTVSAVKEIYKGYKKIFLFLKSFLGERRVALSPAAAANLVKKGIKVNIEKGAGALASFNDDEYGKAGANLVDKNTAFSSDVVLKVLFYFYEQKELNFRFGHRKNPKLSSSKMETC